ncbi:hypothetical protein ANO14919_113500 [Xylariales sp. No.14919]|nr:hypothetical protein ANO14919_113500 [Xylariales sp. No.14919]
MLDALCFIWDREGKSLQPETKIETMPEIYRAIEEELWRKDIIRLRKREDGELLTPGHIKSDHRPQLEELAQDEIKFLERLAFTGLYKEDYFAARYFIRQLETKEPLQYGNGGTDSISTTSYIEQHKYTARYDIMWRFVASLLASKQNDGLNRLLDTINKKPRDLLGPTHKRLIIHFLNESDPEKELETFPLREKIENELQCWASEEYDIHRNIHLYTSYMFIKHEQEFPPHILKRVFINKNSSD